MIPQLTIESEIHLFYNLNGEEKTLLYYLKNILKEKLDFVQARAIKHFYRTYVQSPLINHIAF